MLAYLDGILTQVQPGICVVDIHGVGFLTQVPLAQTYAELKLNEEIKLYTHYYVRDDAVNIYGFLSQEEREFFLLLISVTGIGPKNALNMLSFTSPNMLCTWLIQEDVASLKKIPGVGVKTAQRLILELKSKVSNLSWAQPEALVSTVPAAQSDSLVDEAIEAMLSLGYDLRQARIQVLKAAEAKPEANVETLIKDALQQMLKL